jgi:hypothetical protein
MKELYVYKYGDSDSYIIMTHKRDESPNQQQINQVYNLYNSVVEDYGGRWTNKSPGPGWVISKTQLDKLIDHLEDGPNESVPDEKPRPPSPPPSIPPGMEKKDEDT